jgi:FdhE protein
VQQRLIRLLLDASSELSRTPPASVLPESVAERSRRGLPALRNEQVAVPAALEALVVPLCDALADGGAGDAARHVRDAIAAGDLDAGSLVAVSLSRNPKAIRTSAVHMGLSPDLVWLVGELASAPLAHQMQASISRVALDAIHGWDRGYCPFCGSWPAFIESCRGRRQLRCSFCAAAWALQSSPRCVYCANTGDDFVVAAPDMQRRERRIELCAKCGSYTKVISVDEATPFPLLAIEDLATMDLDGAAMERGYRRPELYDFDSIEPLKPAC